MTSPFHATERVPPPSTAALVIAAAILAGVTGFFIGQGASLGVFGAGSRGQGGGKGKERKSWPNSYDVKVHGESEEEEEEEGDEESEEEGGGGEIAAFEGNTEEVKLVLVVRTDLGMGKGKIAAQCSHATLACYKHYLTRAPDSPILKRWERRGQAKVALQVKSEEELLVLQAQAVSLGLCAQVIQDAGRTQIASGSRTVLGILGPRGVVDGVTGGLKLL
ncbi:PTH2 family peptidyl-tRNA hydrolase, variant [Blastomyces gilchristii SLH14081]|uniref:peptidyl-tRNA hydrolase n=1 Tax=Blastomyces gilchristii (strain SLH14081) TaxID=559298 RepID=A0A179UFG2_BLAGS|nr:PTH2 family peptidyl-tRNA hydrolase, variant [Blastomyces gilchristii SLH14081]XP_031577004.1 PTH2 family peptidyl-tRNA hydrolase [Blastomyces gilchristii SLH14081]OAT06018.1 PTH2 family peptidyl-tRNA hydrolase [Blastomyces gilchristii SLH14081]OAT06019.1 PTH2 family peptidyl-tRNA hydrolase, variant [Blastomyces gilchristii SLH14081]